jgi:hypothetical protein
LKGQAQRVGELGLGKAQFAAAELYLLADHCIDGPRNLSAAFLVYVSAHGTLVINPGNNF